MAHELCTKVCPRVVQLSAYPRNKRGRAQKRQQHKYSRLTFETNEVALENGNYAATAVDLPQLPTCCYFQSQNRCRLTCEPDEVALKNCGTAKRTSDAGLRELSI